MKQGTHKFRLYQYLQTEKVITTRTAIIDLGIADLQGVIRDLKKEGISITTEDVKVDTRYFNKNGHRKLARVKEYRLT
tara:strand:+ start:3294 stop:3527 length:234 start_codon:yes stop_codon:yes gene_type:complete